MQLYTPTSSQRVLVTGGASGIGLAVVRAFLDAGAEVGLITRSGTSMVKALTGPLAEYEARVHARVIDVADPEQMSAGLVDLSAAMGGLDAVVASAGIEGEMGASITSVTTESFRRVLDVNVLGVFHAVKYSLPHLLDAEFASITIIGSDSGFVTAPGMLAYNASKGAVAQLTRALSFELFSDYGIRVNSVCPSIVDTPMSRRGMGVDTFEDADFPVNRAEDVARSVLFLASPESRAINGVNLLSDFGYSARSAFPA